MERASEAGDSRGARRALRSGCITEVVNLDGDEAAIGQEELESFIAGFPVAGEPQ